MEKKVILICFKITLLEHYKLTLYVLFNYEYKLNLKNLIARIAQFYRDFLIFQIKLSGMLYWNSFFKQKIPTILKKQLCEAIKIKKKNGCDFCI